jgi:hypothetical protein
MQKEIVQIVGICILIVVAVQFVRQQRKSGEMPFKKYWPVYLIFAWCLGCFAYGLIFFDDAPIHENTPQQPCSVGAFCGKTGRPHTKEEFEAFLEWQTIFVPSMIIGFFSMLFASLISKSKKLDLR